MEKDLLNGKLGTVGSYDLAFTNGKLVAKVLVGASGVSAGLDIELDSDQVLDALAKAIPGTIDDAVFGLIKGALKA